MWSIRQFFQEKTTALNFAYLFTTMGDRMWMFAIGVFVHKLGGMSWVAAQQLVDAFIKLIVFIFIGKVLDKTDRNRAIQTSLAINNISVALSASFFCACFYLKDRDNLGLLYVLSLVGAICFASISRLASEAQRLAFTKDWIVVIVQTNQKEISLSTQNARMTVIDQLSSVILPISTGYMFDKLSWTQSCVIIFFYNTISWILERHVLNYIYRVTPDLARRTVGKQEERTDDKPTSCCSYFNQTSFLAAFGLSLLFMTVLGFDNLAGSYGQKHGMSISALGFLRSCGSLLGILGAVSFSFLEKKVGLLNTALLGYVLQNLFITISAFSTTMPGSPMNISGYFGSLTTDEYLTGVYEQFTNPENHDHAEVPFLSLPPAIIVFFLGITFARYGLWISDPAVTQIMQETIPEAERNSVFSIQSSLCEAFSLLKDAIVIFFWNTELFGGLAIMSWIFVTAGHLFYVAYYLKAKCSYGTVTTNNTTPPQQVELGSVQPKEENASLLAAED